MGVGVSEGGRSIGTWVRGVSVESSIIEILG